MSYRRVATMVREGRERQRLTQEELAEAIGTSRETISAIERERPKKPLDAETVNKLGRTLDVPVIELVIALGYDVDFEGIEDEEEVALLAAYRRATPDTKQAVRAVVGLPGHWQTVESLESLRRLAATDRQDRQGSQG